ncbi:MAG: protease modulator HflC, partial [Shewanella sp.]
MGRLSIVLIAVILGIGLSSVMVVNEGERAIVARFGEIVKDKVDGKQVTR